MKIKVHTDKAPAAIGPYNQAIMASGKFIYVSGQLPLEDGKLVGTEITAQTEKALQNLGAILNEAGYTFGDVVKTTVYLKNMDDFAGMNGVYAKYFDGTEFPARAAFQVGKLPMDAMVEIEAVAVKD